MANFDLNTVREANKIEHSVANNSTIANDGKFAITTIDNPYDPFDNFEEWYSFDEMQARKENRPTCCSYLARMAMNSDDVSDDEYNMVMNDVIDEIVELNLSGKFKKVTRLSPKVPA